MNARLAVLALVALTGCNLLKTGKADDAGLAASASVAATSSAPPSTATAAAAEDAGPVVAKNAAPTATATTKKSNVPTCAKGQQLGSVALSPLKPFCGTPCKTNADCKGIGCSDVNSLGPDGLPAKSGPEYVKLCDPDYVITKPGASGSAAAPAAGPGKCAKNQHWDDISKKCRALGECPPGYQWNDPMQTCLMQ